MDNIVQCPISSDDSPAGTTIVSEITNYACSITGQENEVTKKIYKTYWTLNSLFGLFRIHNTPARVMCPDKVENIGSQYEFCDKISQFYISTYSNKTNLKL